MVKHLAILAFLASYAIAAPTNLLDLPLLSLPLTPSNDNNPTITLSTGFGLNVAIGLEACSGGLTSASVSESSKSALLSWISGAGKQYFDFNTVNEIISWCKSSDQTTLSVVALLEVDVIMLTDTAVSTAGGPLNYLAGMISQTLGSACSCTQMSSKQQKGLLDFIQGAEPELESKILSILKFAVQGGIAETLSSSSKNSLLKWLESITNTLDEELKDALKTWCGSVETFPASVGVPTVSTLPSITLPSVVPTLPSVSLTLPSITVPSVSPTLPSIKLPSVSPTLPSIKLPSVSATLPSITLPSVVPTLPSLPTLPSKSLPSIVPTLPSLLPSIVPTLPTLPSIVPTLPSLPVGPGGGSVPNITSLPNVVLTISLQRTLRGFCSTSVFGELELSVQSGLSSCAHGGSAGALSVEVLANLTSYIESEACHLEGSLISAIKAWISGLITTGTKAGTSKSAYGYISAGVTIIENLNVTGALSIPSQSTLKDFCSSATGLALDLSILTPLRSCASGELSSLLSANQTATLSNWLASSACTLPTELRGTVLVWLSSGSSQVKKTKAVGLVTTLSVEIIGKVETLLNSTTSALSSNCKTVLGVATSSLPTTACSMAGRAELSAFLLSSEVTTIETDVETALFGWLAGSVKDCDCEE